MEPFRLLRAHAAPIMGINIDTDQVLPARFLSKPRSGGFGQYLFHDLRFDENGGEKEEFVLNKPAYRDARILLCEENFGCGSSRENAVWAVYDHGFRAVVAPSFGDIFFSNSLKNGLLPVVLDVESMGSLISNAVASPQQAIEIDLESQTLTDADGRTHSFVVDPFSKHCLLNGIDELDYTLSQMDKIDAYERRTVT